MLTSEKLKTFAKSVGIDLVGIANIERFEGAPPEHDPLALLPETRSVIVIGLRQTRGSLRGIEEGTDWWAYNVISYGGINMKFAIEAQRRVCCFLEDHGYEGVPFIHPGAKRQGKRPAAPGRPIPDIYLSPRIAAVLAGLGEIGLSRQVLTPEFGPRQRFFIILTEAELEPDPLFEGKICDQCGLCVKECPGNAFDPKERDDITLLGRTHARAKLDMFKCAVCHHGAFAKNSPFIESDIKEATNLYDPALLAVPYYANHERQTFHLAICGGKSCIRSCMMHLEEKKKIGNLFKLPFQRRAAWDETTAVPD